VTYKEFLLILLVLIAIQQQQQLYKWARSFFN
jgi:hypothetical protein